MGTAADDRIYTKEDAVRWLPQRVVYDLSQRRIADYVSSSRARSLKFQRHLDHRDELGRLDQLDPLHLN